jgi:hypothetical protein
MRVAATVMALLMWIGGGSDLAAQTMFDEMVLDGEEVNINDEREATMPAIVRNGRRLNPRKKTRPSLWDLRDSDGVPLDSTLYGAQHLEPDSLLDVSEITLPSITFMPPIFYNYSTTMSADSYDMITAERSYDDLNWADRAVLRGQQYKRFMQEFMIQHPELVKYNINSMPQVPKEYVMEVDPQQAKISVREFTRDHDAMVGTAKPVKLARINWLQEFDGSLQFSQAYISPNWYQGGNSNLNGILNLIYNVKLNQKFHPNLIFETSFQYKLAVNNAPEDSVHSYNISEDLFQINSKFGVKAAKRWYYSVNAQFKTQLLNNYKTNTNDLTSAFLSSSDLTVGLGMTYSIANTKKTLDFTAAIAPLSYNLKTCINRHIDPTTFGIEAGHKSVSQYGSSAELTFKAKIAWNIEYSTRMFIFTNYEYLQSDWENTLTFNINRFLSTKLFAHVRYQSDTPHIENSKWQKWQVKEILSIGFSYKFSRI